MALSSNMFKSPAADYFGGRDKKGIKTMKLIFKPTKANPYWRKGSSRKDWKKNEVREYPDNIAKTMLKLYDCFEVYKPKQSKQDAPKDNKMMSQPKFNK